MSDLKPWHRRRDLKETGSAYHAFCHYRRLDVRVRTLARAYTTCQAICPRDKNRAKSDLPPAPEKLPEPLKEATRNWKDWRRRFLWDQRVAEYDLWLEEEERLEAKKAAKDMNDTHAKIARALMGKAIDRLNSVNPADLSPGQLVKWLVEASKLERLARGRPTEILQQSGGIPDLSALSAQEIDTLTALLEKAQGGAA